MHSVVFLVLDSARYDLAEKARTPNLNRLGKIEKRFSYASWTSPSHTSLLMGQMPHNSPKRVFASTVYQQEFSLWSERTGIKNLSFSKFLPHFSLARTLKDFGYATHARVSLPVLNPETAFSRSFDSYRLMPKHNQFHTMVDELRMTKNEPQFHFFNLGETHYPYLLPGESAERDLPRVHGLHGTLRHMGDSASARGKIRLFTSRQMKQMKERQLAAIEYVDTKLGKLFDLCPEKTHFIVTSDHGELFGEDGYFGHGPILHPKVFEVPFVEGKL